MPTCVLEQDLQLLGVQPECSMPSINSRTVGSRVTRASRPGRDCRNLLLQQRWQSPALASLLAAKQRTSQPEASRSDLNTTAIWDRSAQLRRPVFSCLGGTRPRFFFSFAGLFCALGLCSLSCPRACSGSISQYPGGTPATSSPCRASVIL